MKCLHDPSKHPDTQPVWESEMGVCACEGLIGAVRGSRGIQLMPSRPEAGREDEITALTI